MLSRLGIFFIGLTVGGAAFLMTGLASFLLVSQLQYATLQARATQAAEMDQDSTRMKNPVVADNVIQVHYAQVAPSP
jgi:hypothetical protein